ncbi:baseplate wedge initiator [Synechococcus phage ACG-2014f]|uniref:Baseplate wedge initiator n=1 Tax=Synechococcus phage ACG-2014f TaxID=1493511 RepID=A0A0E3G778_9CAUD|nr:baseplate wedge initiator [Synechococcus phage ACG-2014f]
MEISGSQIVDSLITGDLEVTGVTTTKELRFTDAVGVGLTLTNLVVTGNAELNGSGIVTAGQDINFRNLEVAGLSTFVGLQSFRSAVGTALTVYNLRVPENGIVSLPGIPVQGGDAEFRNVNVTGVSSFSGVSTFGSDLYVDGNLFVSGLDFRETLAGENLLVAGVGTVNNLNSNIGIITHLQAGISTFTGITTFQSDASFLSDVYVDGNLNVTGDIRYDEVNGRNLNISGIATIGYSSITDAKIGVATISTLSFGDGVGTALTLTDLTVTGDANLNGSGIVTAGSDVAFRNLEVTGLSTFTGVGTFLSDLYVGGDLFVFNDIKYDEINGRNLNISGISTLGFTSISDIRVSGGSTFLGNVEIDGNLDVTGDLTFDEFDATNANITGIATIGNLLAGVGTITTLSSTDGEITTLTSTDTVVGTLTATDATITTLGVTDSIVGTSTITTLSVTDSVVGTSTITTLNFTDGVGVALTLTDLNVLGEANLNGSGIATAGSDIEFRNLSITGLSTFVGVATFQDDLYVAGNLNVLGDLTYDEVNGRNLNISGIATIGFASITDLRVSGVTTFLGPVNIDGGQQTDFIQTTDLIVTGVATIGYATVTKLIADHSDMRNLNVSGIATIGSLVSDGNGGIIVDGAVSISGIVTIGENSIILDGRKDVEAIYLGDTGRAIVSGITTDGKRTYVKFDDGRFDRLNVSGISTFNDVVSTSSTITNLDVTTATVGFLTATQGYVGVLTVGTFTNDGGGSVIGDDITTRNLNVTGVSTFAGIVTTTGDLYVGGDLFVFNDIFYDEINGRNLNITGVATIGYSSITDVRVSGVATFLGDVNISGVTSVTTLEATGIDAYRVTTQRLIVPDDGFVQLPGIPVSGGSAEFSELLITGISSFVGVATFKDDVYIDGDFIVGGSQVIDNVATENIIISGIATIRTGEITELNVGIATVGFLTATDGYIGVLTAQNYTSLSDERLKSNIETIDDALAGVLRLDGVMFQWNNTGKTDMGVIAQQVEAVFPEIVHGDDTKGVNYNGLIGVLIEAVKELKVENDSLRERLDRLE